MRGTTGTSANTQPTTVIRTGEATPIRLANGSARIVANSSANINTNWSMTVESAGPRRGRGVRRAANGPGGMNAHTARVGPAG